MELACSSSLRKPWREMGLDRERERERELVKGDCGYIYIG